MTICLKLNKSRAAYYKHMNKRMQAGLEDQIIHELVMEKRSDMPRLGGRKLHSLIDCTLRRHCIRMGRDKLFLWLRQKDLLIRPKKRYAKTTQSHHRFRVHKNLIKGVPITRPDQIWVSDITYIRLRKGFCYLALITDAYSRKIVGYDLSDSLELKGCLNALKMACRKKINLTVTHHSDRGIQYCSNTYVNQLKQNNITISMGEAGNCYENAMAERINGILKNEFNLDATFNDLSHAQNAARQAIQTYNELRPHMALGMKKPIEMYAA